MALNKRKSYLDALRIIACFFVIFNHLSGFHAYLSNTDPVRALFYIPMSVMTKIAVPIFFMISGSLLLSKDIKYKDLFSKRILRMLIVLFAASLAAYLISIRKNISSFDFVFFLRNAVKGKQVIEYWYLYAYLGFLLHLPWLRRIAKDFNSADFGLLFAGKFVCTSALPAMNYILTHMGISAFWPSSSFVVPIMTTSGIVYPLMGYYIDRVFDVEKLNTRRMIALFAVTIGGIGASFALTYHQGVTVGYTQDFVGILDYLLAICVFLFVKYLFRNLKDGTLVHRLIVSVGDLTFGIYLIDPILRTLVEQRFCEWVAIQNPIAYSAIWCIFSMTICGLITFGLKKIPYIRKLL